MTSFNTQYAMEAEHSAMIKKRPRHRRGHSHQVIHKEDDGEGSLTYSAASSTSSAGESTDSSFADIMKVLESDAELAAIYKKDPSMQKKLDMLRKQQHQQQQHNHHSSEVSVTSSLNYSTDGESALNGEYFLQTITGQASDSCGPDGGGLGPRQRTQETLDNLLFCEANPAADSKVDSKFQKKVKTPKSRNTTRARDEQKCGDDSQASATKSEHVSRKNPTGSIPPTVPRRNPTTILEDEVWYAKWWMCGFTDAFRDLVPKR